MRPIIIGTGLAGLTTALSLAPMPVLLITPANLGEASSTAWAQGGIAAALDNGDSAAQHAEDTMKAGAGLCDQAVVDAVTQDAPRVIEFLCKHNVAFDRDASGALRFGLEAAHSHRRIIHAADQTGAAIMQGLLRAVQATPSIEVMDQTIATALTLDDGQIAGVTIDYHGNLFNLPTQQVVLATGGAGALWQETSNPLGSWGSGLALAARAGAVLRDIEFMQFHPTCIDIGRNPMPLASEALRGEGCTLINQNGERFVKELQPRDVVARAIWAQRAAGNKVFLDGRKALGENFVKRFPHIHALCLKAGIDAATAPIPVSPGAHYHMGGIATDLHGRTNIGGLWACGEVASTGLHGANRLASNSLLEAASFGLRVAKDMLNDKTPRGMDHSTPAMKNDQPEPDPQQIRAIMSKHVGVLRHAAGLQEACEQLAKFPASSDMALVASLIALAALRREESRGSHARTDFLSASDAWQTHQEITLADLRSSQNINQRATGA